MLSGARVALNSWFLDLSKWGSLKWKKTGGKVLAIQGDVILFKPLLLATFWMANT
jgi:hypothetical protein